MKLMAIDDDKGYLDSIAEKFQPHQVITIHQVQDRDNIPWLMEKIKTVQPDIILMDISFRNQSKEFGIELTSLIRQRYPDQKIIMLTADDPATAVQLVTRIELSFEAGANAYLSKSDSKSYCMEAFEEVFNGEKALASSDLWKRILNHFSGEKGPQPTKTTRLTNKQVQVLQALANDNDYNGIAEVLSVSTNGVAFHLRQLRIKLKKETLQGMVAEAMRRGIVK